MSRKQGSRALLITGCSVFVLSFIAGLYFSHSADEIPRRLGSRAYRPPNMTKSKIPPRPVVPVATPAPVPSVGSTPIAEENPPPAQTNEFVDTSELLENVLDDTNSMDLSSNSMNLSIRCQLFHGRQQDYSDRTYAIENFKPTLLSCRTRYSKERVIAIRKFNVNQTEYVLTVDPSSLRTDMIDISCMTCKPTTVEELAKTRFMSAVTRTTDFTERHAVGEAALLNTGLRHSEGNTKGSYLTGDLCPSLKSLDRRVFETLIHETAHPVKLGLSMSGMWLLKHPGDVQWLKERVSKGELEITWLNHTYHHTFHKHAPDTENFLLLAGNVLNFEVLDTEKALLAHGLTPSVFFRFPGLVSNTDLLQKLTALNLIPIGTDAWLAKGQQPADGSIILVHPNGNEPTGIVRFLKIFGENRVALPLLPIAEAIGH
jgi:hypothetical protein